MSQENKSAYLTLEEILAKYPPKEELFERVKDRGEQNITSQVSRNENGVIVYVVPGSTTYIQISGKIPS